MAFPIRHHYGRIDTQFYTQGQLIMKTAGIAALLTTLLLAAGCGSAAVGAFVYFMPDKAEEAKPASISADAPIAIISTLSGIHSGDIDINYTLTDRNSDPVNLVVEYSIDSGITYATVTESRAWRDWLQHRPA